MLKKFIAILVACIILGVSSISVFAAPTDNVGNTTQPAINSSAQQNQTSSAIKTTGSSSKTAISKENDATSKTAITSESAVVGGSGLSGKNAISSKKPDFDTTFFEIMKDGTAVNDSPTIMTITNPEKDKESTYIKSYVLSGNSKYNDVVISIAKFNEKTGEYEFMKNTDGESSWDIGEFRLFSKEILLTEGLNKIKMLAYRTSEKELAGKENIQVNCYSITLLKETVIQKVVRKTVESLGSIESFGKTKTSTNTGINKGN